MQIESINNSKARYILPYFKAVLNIKKVSATTLLAEWTGL